jgi:uncharacterized protein
MPSAAAVSRGFQVFVKPAGAACNLACRYCYYLGKPEAKIGDRPGPVPVSAGRGPSPEPSAAPARMPLALLEDYIAQHIAASPDEIIRFSWHGGEPTILGVDYFRKVIDIQRRLTPAGRTVANGIQTNGTLLDEEWGRFLSAERFAVGLSIDGPREVHDKYRARRDGSSACEETMRGFDILRRHGVPVDILCVVGAHNVRRPADVYGFFKGIGAAYVSFLPLVERRPGAPAGVSPESVPGDAWGDFLCAVFEEWLAGDIGRIKVQVIEEAARTAFGQEHSLCIFRPVCGDIPVLERNGDLYSCDHFVDAAHRLGNIRGTPLAALLESSALRAFGLAKIEKLPRVCLECEVRDMCNGECPKNRFALAPDGEPGLNYLCPGYKRFFNRVRPFVAEVAAAWRRQDSSS